MNADRFRCPPSPTAGRSMLLAAAAAMTFGLAACTGPTPNPNLDAATQAVNTASNDPQVMKNAPLELQQARQSLDRSQSLWRQEEDRTAVDHYAYLAQRQAETAQQTARLKEAQSAVADADAKRAQALLAARTTEAQQAHQQAAMAQNRAQTLEQQLQQLQSDQNADKGAVLTLGSNILFDVDGTTLKPGAFPAINQIASYLKQHPDRTVTIEGFTDSTGSSAHNDRLSQERAEAVRAALAQAGVDTSRVMARGLGQSQPVASNDTAAGRQLNRRVEVLISDRSGNMPGQALSGSSGRGG
jgi:outer membrane protein OmpA-like peptidoglycan-associated protein